MVSGRAACLVSTNGAPDCKAGADRLCQSKGYKEGKSLDTDAAEKCSPKVYLPGYQRQPGDCRNENYVTQGALPVAPLRRRRSSCSNTCRQRQNAILDTGKIALLVGMTSGISCA